MNEYITLHEGKTLVYEPKSDEWYISDAPPKAAKQSRKKAFPQRLLKKPESLEIILSMGNVCNLNCDYCYLDKQGQSLNVKKSVSNTFNLLIKQLENSDRPTTILFHGGEPLQYFSQIRDFVGRCKTIKTQHHIRFGIQTNATLITQQMANFFTDNNFSVSVSLDGDPITTDAHRKFYNGTGASSLILRGINNLKNSGVRFTVLSVLTKEFVDRLQSNLAFLRNVGAEKYQLNILFGSAAKGLDPDYVIKIFDTLLKDETSNNYACKEEGLSIRAMQLMGLDKNDACNMLPCDMGRTIVSLDIHGNILPCNIFIGTHHLIAKNIEKDNLYDYWKSEILHELQKKVMDLSDAMCGNCPLSRYRTCNCAEFILGNSRLSYHNIVVALTDAITDTMRYKAERIPNVITDV